MKTRPLPRPADHQAAASRAALARLFDDYLPDNAALLARRQNEAQTLSTRIERLRKQREMLQASMLAAVIPNKPD